METVGEHSLPNYGPVGSVKRPVRTRMQGVVEAGGEKPPAIRLGNAFLGFQYWHVLTSCVIGS